MISQKVRLMLLVGLVIFGVTAPGMMIAQDSTATLHHRDILCGPGPDC
jgi:hypothetical protein